MTLSPLPSVILLTWVCCAAAVQHWLVIVVALSVFLGIVTLSPFRPSLVPQAYSYDAGPASICR